MSSDGNSQGRDKKLDRLIDENLKRAFDTVADEPVPDRFKQLIEKLRAENNPTANEGSQDD